MTSARAVAAPSRPTRHEADAHATRTTPRRARERGRPPSLASPASATRDPPRHPRRHVRWRRRAARGRPARRRSCPYPVTRVPLELARRPGLPRGDALRSRELARRRRRGTTAARRAARATRSSRRYVEDWGRKGDVAIVALDRLDEPVGAAWYRALQRRRARLRLRRRPTCPSSRSRCIPECRGQHVGSLLLGTHREPGPHRRVPRDQPERRRGEPRPAPVRAARLRGRRRPATGERRRPHDRSDDARSRSYSTWLDRHPDRARLASRAARGEDAKPCPIATTSPTTERRATRSGKPAVAHAAAAHASARRSCSSPRGRSRIIYSVTAGGRSPERLDDAADARVAETACRDAQRAMAALPPVGVHSTHRTRGRTRRERRRDPHDDDRPHRAPLRPDGDDARDRAQRVARRLAAPDRRPRSTTRTTSARSACDARFVEPAAKRHPTRSPTR